MVASARAPVAIDRFYSPPHLRRQMEQQQHLQAAEVSPKVAPATGPLARPKPRPVQQKSDSDESTSNPSATVLSAPLSSSWTHSDGNVDRFLRSTVPSVSAVFLSKISMRTRHRANNPEYSSFPFYCLGDLWESFKEWSVYGVDVPLILNGNDPVVQYYVPYLSAIQLFVNPSMPAGKLRHNISPATVCESNSEKKAEQFREIGPSMTASYQVHRDDSIPRDHATPGTLVFEYLERDPPFHREPLADKVSVLAAKCPHLKTAKSCDLSPSSWMSVAWYPIYRIPTGPTLKDLDACFLTFHHLATPCKGDGDFLNTHPNASGFAVPNDKRGDDPEKVSLPPFGIALYKFKSSIWTSNDLEQQKIVSSLQQAAGDWLKLRQVDHPDYRFFVSHSGHSS